MKRLMETQAEVGPRYTLVKTIGHGAYGLVWYVLCIGYLRVWKLAFPLHSRPFKCVFTCTTSRIWCCMALRCPIVN